MAVQVADPKAWLSALPGEPTAQRRIGDRSVTERDATLVQPLRRQLTTGEMPSVRWWTWIERGDTAVSVLAENVTDEELAMLIKSLTWVPPATWTQYQR